MTKNKQDGLITLMNPAFGSCFARDDENCPLTYIGCLLSFTVICVGLKYSFNQTNTNHTLYFI